MDIIPAMELIEQQRMVLEQEILASSSPISPWFYGNSLFDCLQQLNRWLGRIRAGKTCWEILGLDPGSSADAIKHVYRCMTKDVHPDRGGSDDDFRRLNQAYREAMLETTQNA